MWPFGRRRRLDPDPPALPVAPDSGDEELQGTVLLAPDGPGARFHAARAEGDLVRVLDALESWLDAEPEHALFEASSAMLWPEMVFEHRAWLRAMVRDALLRALERGDPASTALALVALLQPFEPDPTWSRVLLGWRILARDAARA